MPSTEVLEACRRARQRAATRRGLVINAPPVDMHPTVGVDALANYQPADNVPPMSLPVMNFGAVEHTTPSGQTMPTADYADPWGDVAAGQPDYSGQAAPAYSPPPQPAPVPNGRAVLEHAQRMQALAKDVRQWAGALEEIPGTEFVERAGQLNEHADHLEAFGDSLLNNLFGADADEQAAGVRNAAGPEPLSLPVMTFEPETQRRADNRQAPADYGGGPEPLVAPRMF